MAWHKLSGERVYLSFTLPVQEFLSRTSLLSSSAFQSHPALIDNTLATVTLFLCSTASKSVPARSHSSGTVPNWTSELSNAHKVSRDAYRAWVAAGRPRDINNPFRQNYKSAKAAFRALLPSHHHGQRDHFYASLNCANPRELFRRVRQLRDQCRLPTSHLIVDGHTFSGSSLLDGWALYFESLATSSRNSGDFDDHFKADVTAEFDRLCQLPYSPLDEFSLLEVQQAVSAAPLGKFPGPDGIQAEHLRHGGYPLILFLTRIFNAILVTGRVPASFACGYVIPLLKSTDKDPSIPSNYRGISLTSVVGKVFERLLLSRLLNFICLSPLQGGFRAGQSSLHTAFVFQETVTYLRECGHKAYVAFLDACKAFDTV